MKVEYINPFVTSTTAVFATMLECQITRGEPFVKQGSQPHHEVSGIIGLSGKAAGCESTLTFDKGLGPTGLFERL